MAWPHPEGISVDDSAAAELLQLEAERCRAISAGDVAALGQLLADDLTHTHVTGRTEDKATYLAALGGRPRVTTRRELKVRVHGDAAIMTGTLINAFPPDGGTVRPASEAQALQVWIKAGGGWKLAAFVAFPLPPGPLPPG
jgi:ketosteroid isomerase-like protein